jgi:NADPH2:quinone reductase
MMNAIVFDNPGKPEVLTSRDLPKPTIQKNTQLLVRLKAAGVNPIDIKVRQKGTLTPDPGPHILGCDGAGIVEEVGADVTLFKVGDEVYFCHGGLGGQTGNYAEYTVVDERFVALKPTSLSFAEAAAAPLVLITAWESLYDRARLQAGQKVLVQAGAGGVGHVAIQLAKLQNAEVCTTVSSAQKAEFVKSLGADFVIIYPETDVVKSVLEWTEGEGVDIGFDTIGAQTFYQTCSCVKIYGDVVTILEPDPSVGNLKDARMRNLRISLELMLTPMLKNLVEEQIQQAKILQQCARWIDQGLLKIHLNKTYPLAEASAAHQELESGGMVGKLALIISE